LDLYYVLSTTVNDILRLSTASSFRYNFDNNGPTYPYVADDSGNLNKGTVKGTTNYTMGAGYLPVFYHPTASKGPGYYVYIQDVCGSVTCQRGEMTVESGYVNDTCASCFWGPACGNISFVAAIGNYLYPFTVASGKLILKTMLTNSR
jgi:hypothetical protein